MTDEEIQDRVNEARGALNVLIEHLKTIPEEANPRLEVSCGIQGDVGGKSSAHFSPHSKAFDFKLSIRAEKTRRF